MPRNAQDDGQCRLTIRRARAQDAGVYVCTGSNFHAVDDDSATLVIGGGFRGAFMKYLFFVFHVMFGSGQWTLIISLIF